MKVKECMCNTVFCAQPETNVYQIAKMMNDNHVGAIPICDSNNCLCGIVTDRDIILRTVACDKDVKQTPASEIMTCNVCTCEQEDDLENAEGLMSKNQIRRLPVCDCNNKVVGILSLSNLSENDDNEAIGNTVNNICECSNKNSK